MNKRRLAAVLLAFATATSPATIAVAHATGEESRTDSECSVLTGSALGGPRGECMRCIARPHYHYHPSLPRRQRCHRENRNPVPARRRGRH